MNSRGPLILLHGGRDHCRSWDWTAEELRKDWHVICPDVRGHGDSEWNNTGYYPMLGYVYDLAQLIHQLELAPVTIVAHSMGTLRKNCDIGVYLNRDGIEIHEDINSAITKYENAGKTSSKSNNVKNLPV